MMKTLVKKAEEIARKAHAGQVDKSGRSYIGHIERVANRVTSDEAKCVAWLHDVLEDSYVLNLDLVQTGGGGTDSWSQRARPYDPYRLLEKRYTYSFTISPLR